MSKTTTGLSERHVLTLMGDNSTNEVTHGVKLSEHCNLVGDRNVYTSQSIKAYVSILHGSIVRVIHIGSDWHLADELGNYDPKWRLSSTMMLWNVRFHLNGVVVGILQSYVSKDRKYAKKLDHSHPYWMKDSFPVLTAKVVTLESNGELWARGVK